MTRLDVAHHAINGTFPLDVIWTAAAGAAAYYAAPGADDVNAAAVTVAPDPVVVNDDAADFVASGPSRVADLAGSRRSPRVPRRLGAGPRAVDDVGSVLGRRVLRPKLTRRHIYK